MKKTKRLTEAQILQAIYRNCEGATPKIVHGLRYNEFVSELLALQGEPTKELPTDDDDAFVESYGVSVNEQRYTPNLTDESICVNCDELKSCSNICMDCIKKIVEENQQPATKLTDEDIEKWVRTHKNIG